MGSEEEGGGVWRWVGRKGLVLGYGGVGPGIFIFQLEMKRE